MASPQSASLVGGHVQRAAGLRNPFNRRSASVRGFRRGAYEDRVSRPATSRCKERIFGGVQSRRPLPITKFMTTVSVAAIKSTLFDLPALLPGEPVFRGTVDKIAPMNIFYLIFARGRTARPARRPRPWFHEVSIVI